MPENRVWFENVSARDARALVSWWNEHCGPLGSFFRRPTTRAYQRRRAPRYDVMLAPRR